MTAGRHPNTLTITSIAVALTLLAAGCGSDSAPTTASPAPPTATSTITSTTSAATTPATTEASTTASTTTSTGSAVPVIADNEPRYAFNVLTGAGGGVLLTRLDGSDVVELGADVPGVHKRNDFSPDGEHVVFVDETTETIWIANLDGTPSVQVPGCDHNGCDSPSFSPDGSRLAYSRYENGAAVGPAAVGIEVIDLATGKVTKVVRLERPVLADVPRWSPDGTELVIGVDQMDDEANETGAAIAIVAASGGEPRYLTQFDLYGYLPDWNRVTGDIVFSNQIRNAAKGFDEAHEATDVFTIRPDGSGLRQVTHAVPGEQILGAKWTPDGKAILAYSTKTAGAIRIDPATGATTDVPHPAKTLAPRLRP